MYRKKKITFDSFDLDFYESFVDYLSSAIFKEEGEKLCDGRMNISMSMVFIILEPNTCLKYHSLITI